MKDSFATGCIAACIMMVIAGVFISCTMTPLSATGGSCGEESWNPCYVKIVD